MRRYLARKHLIALSAWLCISIAVYAFCVIFDFALYRFMAKLASEASAEFTASESIRQKQVDTPQMLELEENGFSRVIYPSLVEMYEPIQEIAIKHGWYPLGGQPNSDVYYCNEGYGVVTYTTDRFGFRNDDSQWDRPVDLMIVGDSFVHGACVENKDIISQGMMNRSFGNVVNLGSSANQPLHYAAIGEVFIPAFVPSKVLVVFYANDNDVALPSDNMAKLLLSNRNTSEYLVERKLNTSVQKMYADLGEVMHTRYSMKSRDSADLELGAVQVPIMERATKYLSLSTIRSAFASVLNGGDSPKVSSRYAIENFSRLCATHKCELHVAYLPASVSRPDFRSDRYKASLQAIANEYNIPFHDLESIVPPKNKVVQALIGPHLSPEGYEMVSTYLSSVL